MNFLKANVDAHITDIQSFVDAPQEKLRAVGFTSGMIRKLNTQAELRLDQVRGWSLFR